MGRLPERFVIESELGRGGMGVVYKAFDNAFGRQVAVKVLPDQIAEEDLLYRFRREGTDLAGMSHPNVVHCYEFGDYEGQDFIVMEYVSGGNLRSYVKGCKSLADIVSAYCAICEGLEHIHSQGIVHRDVKPGNILFTEFGMPKITDFGISRRLDSDTQLTQIGTIMGTSSFVAPEMITNGSTVTHSADLYALGVCLFESLTGQLPITGETEYAVLNAHLNVQPAAPSVLRPDIPKSLDQITLQLLEKEPENRPHSAKATGRALRDCLRDSMALRPPDAAIDREEPTEATESGQVLEGLLTIDPQGRIESCNPDAAILLGRSAQELFGQPIDRFLPKMRTLTKKKKVLNGESFRMEGRKRVEQSVPLEVTLTATQSAKGQQLSAVLRPGESDVETLASDLVKAGQFDFLTRMAHEVWTPMNGILGMARLTLNTDLDADQRRYVKALESSAERLNEVLTTALDFSRLGDGTLQLEPVPIDLRQFLESVIKPYLFQSSAKGLDLTTQVDPLIPDMILADPLRLKQVLRHLLQNALKFTDEGRIGVTVARESGDDESVNLKFSVFDTGQGLLEGREKLIFKPFYQEDTSITRKSGGVGLGLAIVQGLVQKMDGRVWADSKMGRGSVFHFQVEFSVVDSSEDTSYRSRMGGLKVLILDPEGEYQQLVQLMNRWGLEVATALNPESAGASIEIAREKDQSFDIVLAEVHGKKFDAYDFVRNYKLSKEAFILFTSNFQDGDSSRCRLLGVDALLEKPLKATELWEAVLKILNNGARSRGANFGSLRILLAEDNPINQTLATVLLSSRGHEVSLAENGLEVLELLKDKDFDLILMDLQMPEMDGITTTKRIRSLELGGDKRIPIIALTAHIQGGSFERCMAAGMDAYLNKPLDEDLLMVAIAEVVDRQPTTESEFPVPAASPEAESEDKSDSEDEHEPTLSLKAPELPEAPAPLADEETETTNYNVIDEKSLMARVGDNSQSLCMLIDIFLNLYPDQVAQIQTAIQENNSEKLFQMAHKFKGSVANFDAKAAAKVAENIENIGRSGTIVGATQEFKMLGRETEKLVIALKALRERHSVKAK